MQEATQVQIPRPPSTLSVEEEQGDATLALPLFVQPQIRRVEQDTYKNRVIVVGPYSSLNTFIEYQIPILSEKTYVDVVRDVEQDTPPYIDVNIRERTQPRPRLLIDFGYLLGPCDREHYGDRILERILLLQRALETYLKSPPKRQGDNDIFQETESIPAAESIPRILDDLRAAVEPTLTRGYPEIDEDTLSRKRVTDALPFQGYRSYGEGNSWCVAIPTPDLDEWLRANRAYDDEGNLLHRKLNFSPLKSELIRDLESILHKGRGKRLLKVA